MAKVWRIAFLSTTENGTLAVNTLHYQTDLEALEEEPSGNNVVDAVSDHLTTAYRAVLPTSMTLNSLQARECVAPGSEDVPGAGEKTVNLAGTFTAASSRLPDAVCMVVSLKTDVPLRSARGYIALPSPRNETLLDTNQKWLTTGTYYTNVEALAALLDDSFDTGGVGAVTLNPVVYSRRRHGIGLNPYTFQVARAIPSNEVHWRRSRTTAP